MEGITPILLSTIHTDPKHGVWYAFGTKRGWFEIRVTKTGYVRIGKWQKGKHPYFTPNTDTEREK